MRRPAAAAMTVLVVSILAADGVIAAGGGGDIDRAFRDECEGAAAAVAAMRTEWGKALGNFAAGVGAPPRPMTVVTVELSKALVTADVHIVGLRLDERWLAIEAYAPSQGVRLEVVDAKSLPIGDGGVEGSISIRVPRRLLWDAKDDVLETFAVSLKPGGAGLAGTYAGKTTPAGKRLPARGSAAKLAGSFALPADFPAVNAKSLDAFAAYDAAVAMEQEVCGRYAQLLWMDHTLRGNGAMAPPYAAPIRPAFAPKADKAPKGKTSAPPAPGIGELGGDLGLAGDTPGASPAGKPAARSAAGHADAKDRLAVLGEIRTHLERLAAIAAAYASEPGAAPRAPQPAPLGEQADKLFGPWYTFRPLAASAGKVNVLPAYAGGEGEQEWLYVDGWQVIGPEALGLEAARSSILPQRLFLPRASYPADERFVPKLDPDDKEAGGAVAEEKVTQWQSCPVDACTGILRPPSWWINIGAGYGSSRPGTPDTTWFAATEIHSDAARELWVAMGVTDDCQLWINDRLAAAWPNLRERRDLESPVLARVSLRGGRNTVLARVRQVRTERKVPGYSGLWLRLCTRGAPLAAGEAAARDKAIAERAAKLRPWGPEVHGWRNNWLGVEDSARPVTAWDLQRNINVLWRTGLPHTISTPLVVGDSIITMGEPHFLIAVDKNSGKVRWRGAIDLLEVLQPELAKKAAPLWNEYNELFAAGHPLAAEPGTTFSDEPPVKVGERTITYAELRARMRDIDKEWTTLCRDVVEKSGHPWKYLWGSYMGRACSTPVTDGKHIWAWTSLGAAACFDMQGNRKWLVELPHKGTAYDAFSSPLLIDGKVIFDLVPEDKKVGNIDMRAPWLLALDAPTGKELWRTAAHDPGSCPSPVAMRIGNGRQEMTVIITAGAGCSVRMDDGVRLRHTVLGGTVVRADDGKVLVENLSVSTGYGTPVAVGDVVYHFGPGMATATRLVMLDRDRVAAVRLWTRRTSAGFEPCISPVGELLYAKQAIVNVGGQGDGGYGIYDAATGEGLYRHVNVDWPLFTTRSTGRCYVPTTVAGGYVFCGDSGEAFGGKKMPQANMTVLQAGVRGRIIAQNGLPPRTDCAMAFDGDRIYYRNIFGLVCLGYTGEEGKAYEAEVNARFLLEDLPGEEPPIVNTAVVPAEKNIPAALPRQSLWGRPGPPYFFFGPVKTALRGEVLAALSGNDRRDVVVQEGAWSTSGLFELGGVKHTLRLEPYHEHSFAHLASRGRYRVFHPGEENISRNMQLKAADDAAWFYTILRCEADQVVRFLRDTKNPGVRCWLGGVPLEHQGRYRLPKGDLTFLAELSAGSAPKAEDLCLDVHFTPSAEDAKADVAAWQADLRAAQPYLERVVKLKPDSGTAKKAKEFLAKLSK